MPALGITCGIDASASNEVYELAADRTYSHDASIRPIIYFPGGTATHANFLTDLAQGNHLPPALANLGWPLISADFGGGSQLGNDNAIDRVGKAWTKVKAELGTATDKFIGVGLSQGATALFNYVKAGYGANVAAIVSIVGAIPMDAIHDEDRGPGLQASINNAYGSSALWEAAKATHDPSAYAADLAGLPIRLYYATNDPVYTEAEQLAFKAAVGSSCSSVSLGAVGHSGQTVPAADLLDFVEAYA